MKNYIMIQSRSVLQFELCTIHEMRGSAWGFPLKVYLEKMFYKVQTFQGAPNFPIFPRIRVLW